jgi:hypothetical protein
MDFEAHWKKVIDKEALLQAELRRNLQRDLLAEFETMKAKVQKIADDRLARDGKNIDAKFAEHAIQFLNTTIVFHPRSGDDASGLSSSIKVTQGPRGPIEYFGARLKNNDLVWQIDGGVVAFRTDQLLDVLL